VQLSTFGLLRDCSIDETRGYIDQIVSSGFLEQTDDAYPVVRLTAEGVELMRTGVAPADFSLSRQRRPTKGKAAPRARVEVESWEGVDRAVFDRLRAMRLEIARSRGVPPYVIFHDSTLRDLARAKPSTMVDLSRVYGMGARKIESFGEIVLETIGMGRS
jgi:ATP-dependent DNA helicase RecQ